MEERRSREFEREPKREDSADGGATNEIKMPSDRVVKLLLHDLQNSSRVDAPDSTTQQAQHTEWPILAIPIPSIGVPVAIFS